MLEPVFFNIYLNGLFFFFNAKDNFADDTTPFLCHKNLAELLEKYERNSELAIHWYELAIHWFEDDYMKLNTGKCHLLINAHGSEHYWVQIGTDMVWKEKITINN